MRPGKQSPNRPGAPVTASDLTVECRAPAGVRVRTQKWVMHTFPTTGQPMTDFTVAFHPIALPKPAAAAALGMSVDSFERYVQADVCCIRRGRMRLYPVVELERWAGENAERLLAQAA